MKSQELIFEDNKDESIINNFTSRANFEKALFFESDKEIDFSKKEGLEKIFEKAKFDDFSFINSDFGYYVPTEIEIWDKQIVLDSRVYNLNHDAVYCDCLVDEDELVFEKREFPKFLFDGISDLKIGKIVRIIVRTAKRKMRVDVFDGKGLVNKKHFEDDIDYDSHKAF
jgi:hypothetical protein